MSKKYFLFVAILVTTSVVTIYSSGGYNRQIGRLDWLSVRAARAGEVALIRYYQENDKLPLGLDEMDLKNPKEMFCLPGHRYIEILYDNTIDLAKVHNDPVIILASYNPLGRTQWVVYFDQTEKDLFVNKEVSTSKFLKWYHALENKEKNNYSKKMNGKGNEI